MRNRVAGKTRSLVTAGLVALFMLVQAPLALAQGGAATGIPVNFAGPVGIAVATMGLSGVLLGLWRFRRKFLKDRLAATEVLPVVEPAVTPEPRTPATTP